MATVIFIHGISNMPKPRVLQTLWESALATELPDNPGVEIGVYGADVELVYWSDVLYSTFAEERTGRESAALSIEMSNAMRGDSPGLEGVSESWVRKVSHELAVDAEEMLSSEQPSLLNEDKLAGAAAEAIPLPWVLKKPLMRAFVRDAHHYLFDVEHSPRSGETYYVRQEIRKRFVSKVKTAALKGPVIIFSHSLGTVIAYDCLKNVDDCPPIQNLITVGSPLGMSEIQDKLVPGYTSKDGYPYEKVHTGWDNVYDPVDIISRADPNLRNDYLQSGSQRVSDIRQNNGGLWTHGMLKYAAQADLRGTLRETLKAL